MSLAKGRGYCRFPEVCRPLVVFLLSSVVTMVIGVSGKPLLTVFLYFSFVFD